MKFFFSKLVVTMEVIFIVPVKMVSAFTILIKNEIIAQFQF
jgi:hypothetical protein